MFLRLHFVRPLLRKRQGVQQTTRFMSKWVDGGDHATHNDLPVPEGNWKEYHARRNMLNNLVLLSGTVALIAAAAMLFNSEAVNFNFSPPDHYDSDVAECGCDAHSLRSKDKN